jgi:hypothetical protein
MILKAIEMKPDREISHILLKLIQEELNNPSK